MKKYLGLIILLLATLVVQSQNKSLNIRVHDPVMIQENNTYYLFCTGMGISVYSSKDMVNWVQEKPVFSKSSIWTEEVVPGFRGHIWAPDIHYYNGLYYLYYSVSAFGKNTSAIGVATNKTLDADNPDYQWKDQGKVLQSIPNRDLWNAIDPNIIEDDEGYPWMSFGSFWEGLKLVKLIPNRTALTTPQEWYTVAKRKRSDFLEDENPGDAALEAPFIFKRDTMYYLFVSWDYCCRGENSTYKVVVGRSENVQGPYFDKDGKTMDAGGGSMVIEGNKDWAGIGHNSAYKFNDQDYFVCHGYDAKDGGAPKLRIFEMDWDQNGWPILSTEITKK